MHIKNNEKKKNINKNKRQILTFINMCTSMVFVKMYEVKVTKRIYLFTIHRK